MSGGLGLVVIVMALLTCQSRFLLYLSDQSICIQYSVQLRSFLLHLSDQSICIQYGVQLRSSDL